MDVTKVLDKTEKKLFKKQNANFSAKIYFRLIEDTLESNLDSLEKQKIIEIYISQLDKIYDDSIGEKKGNLLKTNVIEKYSVLKYFMKISSSGSQLDPATNARLSPTNDSTMGSALLAFLTPSTRSKRVSPLTVTQSMPIEDSSFLLSSFCTKKWVKQLRTFP